MPLLACWSFFPLACSVDPCSDGERQRISDVRALAADMLCARTGENILILTSSSIMHVSGVL